MLHRSLIALRSKSGPRILTAGAVVALAACASPGERVGTARQAVFNGYPSTVDDNSIVLLANNAASDVCTATLVAPNLLVTAHHCVVATKPKDGYACGLDGTLLNPSLGLGLLDPANAPAQSLQVYVGQSTPTVSIGGNQYWPGWADGGPADANVTQVLASSSTTMCADDIAFVVLDRDLAESSKLVPIPMRFDRAVHANEAVSIVGYGETDQTGVGYYSPTRMRKDNIIVEFADWLPKTFTVGPLVCKGDSGGPAIDKLGRVAGLYSFGSSGLTVYDCSSPEMVNYFVQIADYRALTVQAFQAAGQPVPSEAVQLDGGTPDAGTTLDAGSRTPPEDGGVDGAAVTGDGGSGAGSPEPTSHGGGCSVDAASGGDGSLLIVTIGVMFATFRRRRGILAQRQS